MDASSQAHGTTTPTPASDATPTPATDTVVGSYTQPTYEAAEPAAIDVEVTSTQIGGKITSDIWNHFTRKNVQEAECNYCNKIIKAHTGRNGTSGMWKHFNRCKQNPNKPKPKGQQTLTLKPATLGEDEGQLMSIIFSQEKCKRAVVEFIIIDEKSFREVEGEGFKRLMHVLEPRFFVPSRMTVYRCLLEMYVLEKEKLKNYFKSSKQRVSLTTDTWTLPNNFNYICVTVHFIDQHWKLEKRFIMFTEVSGHKGIDIG